MNFKRTFGILAALACFAFATPSGARPFDDDNYMPKAIGIETVIGPQLTGIEGILLGPQFTATHQGGLIITPDYPDGAKLALKPIIPSKYPCCWGEMASAFPFGWGELIDKRPFNPPLATPGGGGVKMTSNETGLGKYLGTMPKIDKVAEAFDGVPHDDFILAKRPIVKEEGGKV